MSPLRIAATAAVAVSSTRLLSAALTGLAGSMPVTTIPPTTCDVVMRNLRRWILVRTLKIPSQFGGALAPGGQGSAVPVHETGGWRRSARGPDPDQRAGRPS